MAANPATGEKVHKPSVTLDVALAESLQNLAAGYMNREPSVASRLLEEVERAVVVPSDKLPANVVAIGSEVTFRDESTGRARTIILVLPQDADIALNRVSVLTPIGAALVGLSAGASIDWDTRDGQSRELTIVSVAPSDGA